MLESRYLHLHEALGLGPMWLKQGARLLPPAEGQDGRFQTASDTAPTVHTSPQPATAVREDAKQPSGNAHAATLAAIGGASRRQSREPSVPKPAEPAANTANTLSDTLQDGIIPQTQANAARRNTEYIGKADGIIPQTQANAARLLAVSICPAPADLAAGRLFSGADGVLLDNMLAAIGLTAADCRRTSWLPSVEFSPDAARLQAAAERMRHEAASGRIRAVLLLGQFFEQPENAEAVAATFGNLPVFTVPHPARMLRQPQLKARAWTELKRLRQYLEAV